MQTKLTVVYEKRWMCGSQQCCLTKIARVLKRDDETVIDCLHRYNLAERAVYIFQNWPPFLNDEAPIKESTELLQTDTGTQPA